MLLIIGSLPICPVLRRKITQQDIRLLFTFRVIWMLQVFTLRGGAQVMPPMPPVEALMDQHVNGSNDEHHMTSLDESVTGSETGEPLLAPEDPSHQHHG